ncbi:MAG: TlpA family protein disulfide reductase [Chlorobiaceae bacterium]|nr:TlpA family protein disulfide reductase [Chlorobiales bacterium]NTU90957.1 TlpA family protein disulfide reductase [Chlorobiaceae bacterium]NTV26585.1 TlpA family protein disulfide reductase [Chlorobiaceae bacterium]
MKPYLSRMSGLLVALILVISSITVSGTASAAPVKAPAFTGVTVDGKPISSADLKGKAYIVNFFATWCPPCRSEIPDMVAVQKAWAPKGFTFIGIAVNETVPSVKSFMKSNGITYPVIMATPALVQTYNRYVEGGITGIPTTFVIDASGNMTNVIVGPRSKAAFEQIISTSIAKKPGK